MIGAEATALLDRAFCSVCVVCVGDAAGIRDVEGLAGFWIPIQVGGVVSVLHFLPNCIAVADVMVLAAAAPERNV